MTSINVPSSAAVLIPVSAGALSFDRMGLDFTAAFTPTAL